MAISLYNRYPVSGMTNVQTYTRTVSIQYHYIPVYRPPLVQLGRIFKVNYHCNHYSHYLLYTHTQNTSAVYKFAYLCITCLASYIANNFDHSTISFVKQLSHSLGF